MKKEKIQAVFGTESPAPALLKTEAAGKPEWELETDTTDGALLRYRPDIMRAEGLSIPLKSGSTILEAVTEALRSVGYSRHFLKKMRVYVSSALKVEPVEVPQAEWSTRKVQEGDFIQLAMPMLGGGGGNKNPLRTVLLVVVAIIATIVSCFAPYLAGAAGTAWGAVIGALASSAVMFAGYMLVNAIAPLPKPKLPNQGGLPGKSWSIDGTQNRVDYYNMVPLPLGKVRFAPRYAALPYTSLRGSDQYAHYLFCVAGANRVSELCIGGTPLSSFANMDKGEAKVEIHENWQGEKIQLFPASIIQEDVQLSLTHAAGSTTRTTALDTEKIGLEIIFPRGLCYMKSNGKRYDTSVTMQLEYRKKGDEEWLPWNGTNYCNGGEFNALALMGKKRATHFYIGIAPDGSIRYSLNPNAVGTRIATGKYYHHYEKYDREHGYIDVYKYTAIADISKEIEVEIPIDYRAYDRNNHTVKVGPGFRKFSWKTISAQTLTPFRRCFELEVERGQYEVRITRINGDPDPNSQDTLLTETSWSALRSYRAGKPLKYSGVPLTVMALELKATDKLNGHLQEFNAIFESRGLVWTGSKWMVKPTSNPASLALLLATSTLCRPEVPVNFWKDLTTEALANNVDHEVPAAVWKELDEEAWKGFYLWCEQMGWRYNGVLTSQEQARETLHNLLSAGRGALDFSNGKLSVTWDAVDKPSTAFFGPRNSWGFQATKHFVQEQPHGLRYRFLNEKLDYQEDERIVYADGYAEQDDPKRNLKGAVNIVEMEQDGITDPELIYRHGRLRLADSIWRPEIYEFNTDFAFLSVSKGDRIEFTHDVPMWGLAQARVSGVIYADYDLEEMNGSTLLSLGIQHQSLIRPDLTLSEYTKWLKEKSDTELRNLIQEKGLKNTELVRGIVLDELVSMEEDHEYAIKYFPFGSSPLSFSIKTVAETTNILEFLTDIPSYDAPTCDGLISFGRSEKESHSLIVVGITAESNLSAKITCQDYSAEQIYKALTEEIPAWESDISLPPRWQLGKPLPPVIEAINTNEYVLKKLADGTLIPRIQVNYSLPQHTVETQKVRIEIRNENAQAWHEAGITNADQGFVYAEDVEEQVEYELRLCSISPLGITSDYTQIYKAKVIGRTTPPPAPLSVHIDENRIWWEMQPDYPVDVVGWEVWMSFDQQDEFSAARRLTQEYTPNMEFDLSRWAGHARRVWIRTRDVLGLVSEPVGIATNLGDVQIENVVLEYRESWQGWSGTIENGTHNELGLVPAPKELFWDRQDFWESDEFWSLASESMRYTTRISAPPEAAKSYLHVLVDAPQGGIGNIEYRFIECGKFWDREKFWDTKYFWGVQPDGDWKVMPDGLFIEKPGIIEIRITTLEGESGLIRDIRYIFDVEDEYEIANDLLIPAEGIRVPLEKSFRWIESVSFGLEYHPGSTATQVVWLDKGLKQNGFVTKGPFIRCLDSQGAYVSGIADVTLRGAKGV